MKLVFQTPGTLDKLENKVTYHKQYRTKKEDTDEQSSSSFLKRDERCLFPNKYVIIAEPEVPEVDKKYHQHCKHCPAEDAWYLELHLFMEDVDHPTAASRFLQYTIMY